MSGGVGKAIVNVLQGLSQAYKKLGFVRKPTHDNDKELVMEYPLRDMFVI